MKEFTRVAILGSGNIGTDLMMKVLRNGRQLQMGVLVGVDPQSDGLARARSLGVATTAMGVDDLVTMPEFRDVDIVFDATSAGAHAHHNAVLPRHGVQVIDLTPAAIGPYVVPTVNLDRERGTNLNMVTCGGQATIPIVAAVSRVAKVQYAEIVASIASRSAGPGTRASIDEFTETTRAAIEKVGGAERGKAIIILNPAEPPLVMRDFPRARGIPREGELHLARVPPPRARGLSEQIQCRRRSGTAEQTGAGRRMADAGGAGSSWQRPCVERSTLRRSRRASGWTTIRHVIDSYSTAGYGGISDGLGTKPAVLVVDMQLGFTDPRFPLGRLPMVQAATDTIADLLKVARAHGVPVAKCYTAYGSVADMPRWKVRAVREEFLYGHPCTALDLRLHDERYDFTFCKNAPSMFFLTPLVTFLAKHQVDTVIVTGCVTSGCVRATIIDAFSYGFRIAVPEDCCGDAEREAHEANLRDCSRRYCEVTDLQATKIYIQRLAAAAAG